ncbi:hypothetical protein CEUSTIGMA_g9129.t1 [Chlamydomonas eustigma]|uniref:Uncharacterized protein n=1 Tax=Chlamydomonas eustigma TaxID=1157962 RepID=A0A250XF60_9CHLO|nr:hypothetical protein CEUSTIGMA_g9129.t1 [Chlamydomonas eustigma]|eukprot:GAX81701.1 hypothetical protein CEUSTIGMA_g9129.t1 [Chlamydomonas eustigma]
MFTADEQDLVNRLREKYYGQSGSPAGEQTGDASYSLDNAIESVPQHHNGSSTSSEVVAKICIICHGTGTKVEEYNHRRLESFCSSCHGNGVNLYRNGVEIIEKPSSSANTMQRVVERKYSLSAAVSEKRERLQADIAAIDEKLDMYNQERSKLSTDIAHNQDEDPEGMRLMMNLLSQLEAQISKLTDMRKARAVSLEKFLPHSSQS